MPFSVTSPPQAEKRQKAGTVAVAAIVVALIALFVWVPQLAMLTSLTGSDAAGNGMAQGFAALAIIVLWVLLAVLMILAGVAVASPMFAIAPGLVLLPLSGFAAMTALDLLSHPGSPPSSWPMVVSVAAPPLIVLLCLWAVIPPVRAVIPAWLAAGLVWSVTLVVSVSVWPMMQAREAVLAQGERRREAWDADYARLPPDAPLWDRVPFLETASGGGESAVVDGIRHLVRRQSDAELMLERGDFPLRYLGQIDLEPTRQICDAARILLRKQVETLVVKNGESKHYAMIRWEVGSAVAAMEWLVGYDCPCDAEALAWETMATAYRDPEYDVFRLRGLRDPEVLGRVMRESPAHFSMLSGKSHLKGWLGFAGDAGLREQALEGARALDRRTEDAVEILGGTEHEARELLIYLPALDLEATPTLCEAARREVHRELARIYRPASDDPRPYRELLERMGTGEPLRALVWLAEHGCETTAELGEAEELIGAYRDSPERAAILTTLGRPRRK